MHDNLIQLAERARKHTSATEAAEILMDVKELAGEKEPILFLLNALLSQSRKTSEYKTLWEYWLPVNDLVQEDRLTKFAIGSRPGDLIPDGVHDFLKRYVEANREFLEREYQQDMERIRAVNAATKKRLTSP